MRRWTRARCGSAGGSAFRRFYRGDSTLASAPGGWVRPLWRLHTRQRLHRYSAWLAVGRNSADYLASFRVPEPLTFRSPHAVDNDLFGKGADRLRDGERRSEWRRTHGLDPQAFVVMFAGKFVSAKRPLDIVAAVASMNDPRVQVLFVGSGELEGALKAAVDARNIGATFPGFMNQHEMPAAFAAADCLVLPSGHETWGLIVNEAMAAGLPAVVSDRVGCAPDLVVPGETGEVVPVESPEAMGEALARIARRVREGHQFRDACRARVNRYTYEAATDGLAAAVTRLTRRAGTRARNAQGTPRVIGLCGGMVIPGGLERMTFEVIRVLREAGAAAHVIVNTWESTPIVAMAERVDASWSTGYYWHPISSRLFDPRVVALMVIDSVRTSAGLLRDAWRFRPTTILAPDTTRCCGTGRPSRCSACWASACSCGWAWRRRPARRTSGCGGGSSRPLSSASGATPGSSPGNCRRPACRHRRSA